MTATEQDHNISAESRDHLLQVFEMEMSRISSLDSTIFTIKGWMVTLVSALIGFSFTSPTAGGTSSGKGLLWVAVVAAVIFMIIDLHFRKVQLGNVATITKIRELLMGLSTDMPEFKDRKIWEFLWKDQYGIEEQNNGKLARHFNDYFFTILPYGIVIVGLLVLISI